MSRALKSLQSHGVVIAREAWLKEAEAAERAQPACVLTCRCGTQGTCAHMHSWWLPVAAQACQCFFMLYLF